MPCPNLFNLNALIIVGRGREAMQIWHRLCSTGVNNEPQWWHCAGNTMRVKKLKAIETIGLR
jgi:hypothetical protein